MESLNPISPSSALFIKLGAKGKWEAECLEKGTIRLGFSEFEHADLVNKKYDLVRRHYEDEGRLSQSITMYENQIRYFYETGEDVLWITFYNQRLWWCQAEKRFEGRGTELKLRYVKDKWRCTNIRGEELLVDNLSGHLLKTQGFQSTICNVEAFDYLVKKINAEQLPEVIEVKKNMELLKLNVSGLIRQLTPKDFELFVDLIFRQTGYQRINVIGGPQKTKDIELLSPVTKERILVQVKCSSSFAVYKDYENYFNGIKGYDRFFYVVHSPDDALRNYIPENAQITLWKLDTLSDLCVNAGLTSWLINKIN